jgi:plastocyanin
MANDGPAIHEFEVLDADGKALGEIGPTAKGKDGEVVLTFDKAGTYAYTCGVADHEARGMVGTFQVT